MKQNTLLDDYIEMLEKESTQLKNFTYFFAIDKEYEKFLNQENSRGNTVLHIAAELGNTDFIKKACESGGDPNIANHLGETPLHVAV